MKKIITLSVMLIGFGWALIAQQEPHFTMYMFNKQMINPAYSGSREVLSLTGLYRKQWVDIDGAPETFNVGGHSPFNQDADFSRVAIGGVAYGDRISVFDQYGLYGQYAYRIPLTDDYKTVLSMGLQAGVDNFSGKFSQLDPRDPFAGDVAINQDIQSAWLPNFGAGAYLYSEYYYLGVSVPRIIQNKYDPDANPQPNEQVARQFRHYFAMGGLVLPLGDAFKIRPNIMAKYTTNPGKDIQTPLSMDYNLSFLFLDRFLLGASFRTNVIQNNDSFDAIFEMQVTQNIRMGYAFDYTLSELQSYNSGTHEIMIGYEFGKRIKAFTTPRFIKYF